MSELILQQDEFGPHQIVHIFRRRPALRAIVVIDNIACGPSLGGVRMAPDVSLEECRRLARAMTMKNAAAGLPFGGGKSVIFADPAMPAAEKEQTIRAFAASIATLTDYVPGPDMGTNERAMAWVLDEIGATGFGCAIAAEVATEMAGIPLKGARIAVQGFGAVGRHAARMLVDRGAILVAAADSKGTVSDAGGLDVNELMKLKQGGGSVIDLAAGKKGSGADIIGANCDIWIPAARPDVLTEENVRDLKARIVIQGANIPATAGAEAYMHAHGILNVPDFIANAGGVITGAIEYRGGTEKAAFEVIETRVRRNVTEVLAIARKQGCEPRAAAVAMAAARVRHTMALRRFA